MANRLSKLLVNPAHAAAVGWSVIERRLLWHPESWAFDFLKGIETSGRVGLNSLNVGQQFKESLRSGNPYEALPVPLLRRAFRLLRGQNLQLPRTFVDIGCGKGRGVFYAAQTGLFESVVGIEYAADLVDAANSNLKAFRSKTDSSRVSIFCADASNYDLPNRPVVCFMFNPFGEPVFSKFFERNAAHFAKNKSFVLYCNNVYHATLVDGFGFSVLDFEKFYPLALYNKD